MAKENYVSLKGQLKKDVKYIVDPETGQIRQALFQLVVMRRDIRNRASDFSPRFDKPVIATCEPDLIKAIQTLNLYDIVEVKGTFKTGYVTKRKQCPLCGKVNTFTAPVQYVLPIYSGKCTSLSTGVEGIAYLRDCAEISNIVKVIGRVCSENITVGETEKGNKYAKYKIAINRKYFDISSVDEEDHADYPIVYSYDDVADSDEAMLCQNALIYLDGYLHTMELDQEVTCCECGQNFPIKIQRTSLTPYANEYLRDYKEMNTNDSVDTSEPQEEHIGDNS